MAIDANGYPIDFDVVHDSQTTPKLIELVGKADYLVADKGCDSKKIIECARTFDMIPVIPRRSNSSKGNPEFDGYLYRLRHLVENAFVHLKHFRAIATRYDKLARNYKVMFATGMHLYLV